MLSLKETVSVLLASAALSGCAEIPAPAEPITTTQKATRDNIRVLECRDTEVVIGLIQEPQGTIKLICKPDEGLKALEALENCKATPKPSALETSPQGPTPQTMPAPGAPEHDYGNDY